MAHATGGGKRHDHERPLRVLAIAPGDPGGSPLELIGPHAAVAYACSAGDRLRTTILTDEETARRFAGLPPGNELLVAPLWRVLPRSRAIALRSAARLQTGLACLAALFGEIATTPSPAARLSAPPRRGLPRHWDLVHAWGSAAILPAAAAARALKLPWAWTPPGHAPRAPWLEASDLREDIPDDDEHGAYAVEWASGEADLIVAEDAAQARAIRSVWAPAERRFAPLPFDAVAGWDESPARSPAAHAPHRIALLAGTGTTPADMDAALQAVRSVRRLYPAALLGMGCRQGAAAAAFRAGVRRHDLMTAMAWRDLDPAAPIPEPSGDSGLGELDVAVILGREAPPPKLLATLWRQGTSVILARSSLAAPDAAPAFAAAPACAESGPIAGDPDRPPALAFAALPVEPAAIAAALLARCAERAERWLACRTAWRGLWPEQPCSPEELGEAVLRAYARLAGRDRDDSAESDPAGDEPCASAGNLEDVFMPESI